MSTLGSIFRIVCNHDVVYLAELDKPSCWLYLVQCYFISSYKKVNASLSLIREVHAYLLSWYNSPYLDILLSSNFKFVSCTNIMLYIIYILRLFNSVHGRGSTIAQPIIIMSIKKLKKIKKIQKKHAFELTHIVA